LHHAPSLLYPTTRVNAAAIDDEARARRTALAIAPGVVIAGIGGGMAFPILPLVGLKAGLSLPFIGVILAANRFARVVSSPLVGAAVDRIGGKRVFVAGLVLQVAVLALYVLGVVSGHPGPLFLAGRLLHGPGSSCVFVSSQTLALNAGGARHRGLASGIVRSAQAASVPTGLVLGGILAGLVGPAGAFAVAAGVPLVAAAVGQRMIPDLRGDATGRPTLRQSLATVLDPRVLAIAVVNFASSLAAQGVVLTTLVLVIHERRIAIGGLSDETASGVFMAALVMAMVASTPLAGRISDRPGGRAPLVAGGLAVMAAGLLATGFATSASSLGGGLALLGLGVGTLTTPLLALVGDIAPPEVRGSVVGAMQLFGDAGATIGPLLGTVLLGRSDATAYAGSAALLVFVLPVAVWLAIVERRMAGVAVAASVPSEPPGA
jgi:MFS family permease